MHFTVLVVCVEFIKEDIQVPGIALDLAAEEKLIVEMLIIRLRN